MAEDLKKETDNATPEMEEKKEEQNKTPDGHPVDTFEKHPIRKFFSKHKKKIGVGLGLAGAFGAGFVADRFGISLGGKKKPEDAGEDVSAE